jgi:hypothetical protein
MVTVTIDGGEREFASAAQIDEGWVNRQLNRRPAGEAPPCIQVRIRTDRVAMALATEACPASGAPGRSPNPDEHQIYRLWEDRVLSAERTAGGLLIDFLRKVFGMLR